MLNSVTGLLCILLHIYLHIVAYIILHIVQSIHNSIFKVCKIWTLHDYFAFYYAYECIVTLHRDVDELVIHSTRFLWQTGQCIKVITRAGPVTGGKKGN